MNIEQARDIALSAPLATEDEFAPGWISYRIDGKWFMLIQLDAPEPRIALKFRPEEGIELRGRHPEITPAYTNWGLSLICKNSQQPTDNQSFISTNYKLGSVPNL